MRLGLLSDEVTGQQAAFRHVTELGPCEPEMWMALNDLKIAWTSSRTKRFSVPYFDSTARNSTVVKYCNRVGNDGRTQSAMLHDQVEEGEASPR